MCPDQQATAAVIDHAPETVQRRKYARVNEGDSGQIEINELEAWLFLNEPLPDPTE